jgi:hypothetical protein
MPSNEEILGALIAGIPRVAQRIAGLLNDEQRAAAFEAVERSYLQTALDLDYTEVDARDWLRVVMDALRADVEGQARNEPQLEIAG